MAISTRWSRRCAWRAGRSRMRSETGLSRRAVIAGGTAALEAAGIGDARRAALRLAAENRAIAGARVALVQANLCEALRPGSLDALVSNPPYLTAEEYAALDRSVRDWEPELALAAGRDGLDAIGRVLEAGLEVVRPGGWLALEVDRNRAALCARRGGAAGGTERAVH